MTQRKCSIKLQLGQWPIDLKTPDGGEHAAVGSRSIWLSASRLALIVCCVLVSLVDHRKRALTATDLANIALQFARAHILLQPNFFW
eukprot:3771590-Pleurochrysis_carterae.AAC.1